MKAQDRIVLHTKFRVVERSLFGDERVVADQHNLVTDLGLTSIAATWGSNYSLNVAAPVAAPRYIAVGSGVSLAPAANQTTLENEVFRKAIDPMPAAYSGNSVTFQVILDYNEPSGPGAQPVVISEAALFSGFVSPTFAQVMISRVLVATPLVKTSSIQFLIQFIHTFARA